MISNEPIGCEVIHSCESVIVAWKGRGERELRVTVAGKVRGGGGLGRGEFACREFGSGEFAHEEPGHGVAGSFGRYGGELW